MFVLIKKSPIKPVTFSLHHLTKHRIPLRIDLEKSGRSTRPAVKYVVLLSQTPGIEANLLRSTQRLSGERHLPQFCLIEKIYRRIQKVTNVK
jgi:hypothetical protein